MTCTNIFKKFFCGCVAIILLLCSITSCGLIETIQPFETKAPTSDELVSASNKLDTHTPSDSTPSQTISDNADKLDIPTDLREWSLYTMFYATKVLGVRSLVSFDQINADHLGSGLALNAKLDETGVIVFKITANEPCTYRVWVDGVAYSNNGSAEFSIVEGENQIVLWDIAAGVHNVELIKISGSGLSEIKTVAFKGTMQSAPTNAPMYIEYVGGSIFEGAASDCTQAYPMLTSKKLNADYSILQLSKNQTLANGYLLTSEQRDAATSYTFERKADVVVVDVTPDMVNDEANFEEELKKLLTKIREMNTECKIYCVYEAEGTATEAIQNAVDFFGGDASNIFIVERTIYHSATEAQHEAFATVLMNQITRSNEGGDDSESDDEQFGTIHGPTA